MSSPDAIWVAKRGTGKVITDYVPTTDGELALEVGQELDIFQECGDMYRGRLLENSTDVLLDFPASHVTFVRKAGPPPPPPPMGGRTVPPLPTAIPPTPTSRASEDSFHSDAVSPLTSPVSTLSSQGNLPIHRIAPESPSVVRSSTHPIPPSTPSTIRNNNPFASPNVKKNTSALQYNTSSTFTLGLPYIDAATSNESDIVNVINDEEYKYNDIDCSITEVLDSYRLADLANANDIAFDTSIDLVATRPSSLSQLRASQQQIPSSSASSNSTIYDAMPQMKPQYTQSLRPEISRIGTVSLNSHPLSSNSNNNGSNNGVRNNLISKSGFNTGEVTIQPKLLHVYLDVKVCIFHVAEDTELFFSLYCSSKNKYISEDYVVNLPPPGSQGHTFMIGRMQTIFANIDPEDISNDLWLVVRIFRKGTLQYDASKEVGKASEKTPLTRRCFGCAVTGLSSVNMVVGKAYEPPPADLTIYTPNVETDFSSFHKTLIAHQKRGLGVTENDDFESAPRAKGIALSLTLLEGDLADLRKLNRVLSSTCITNTICPVYLKDPYSKETKLHIRLGNGNFQQDKKSAARNIETRVSLVSQDYTIVPRCIQRGSGEDTLDNFVSSVYYHSNTPTYDERYTIILPENASPQDYHLMFEFWHVSTTAKKSAVFSNAFLPLSKDGRILSDGTYTVTTFKPWDKKDQYLSAASKLTPRDEMCILELSVDSTLLTANETFHNLNLWNGSKPQLLSLLPLLTSSRNNGVSNVELVEYIGQIVPSLLSVLGNPAWTDLHQSAFSGVVNVLYRLCDDYYPVLKKISKTPVSCSVLPKFMSFITSTITSLVEAAIAPPKASSSPSSPTSGSSSNPEKGKLSTLRLDPESSGSTVRIGVSASTSAEDCDEMLIKLARVYPLLLNIINVTSATAALPCVSREEVAKFTLNIFDQFVLLIGTDIEDKPKSIPMIQQLLLTYLSSSLLDLSGNTANNLLTDVQRVEVLIKFVETATAPHLYTDVLLLLNNVFTGVTGILPVPLESTASVYKHKAISSLHSNVRAWCCLSESMRQRALDGEAFVLFVPTAVKKITTIVNASIEEGNLTDPYLSMIILQFMYTKVHTICNRSTLYATRIPTVLTEERGLEARKAFFHILPCLTNLVYFICSVHPSIILPHSLSERPTFMLPQQWVLQLGFVDIVQDTFMLFHTLILDLHVDFNSYVLGLSTDVRKLFVEKCLFISISTLQVDYNPITWFVPNMISLRSMIFLSQEFATILTTTYQDTKFNHTIWSLWLLLCLNLNESQLLRSESMGELKRQHYLEKYEDLHVNIYPLMMNLWNSMSDAHRVQTAFMIVDKLMHTWSYNKDKVLQNNSLQLYFDLLRCEYTSAKSFQETERHTIDSLYTITNDSFQCGLQCMELLTNHCQSQFNKDEIDEGMKTAGNIFLQHINTLSKLMVALFSYPNEERYEDDRTSVALHLIDYLEKAGSNAKGRKIMHTRYVQFIVDLHNDAKNYVEAGIASLQQAHMLEWSDNVIDSIGQHPVEPERNRKERLILNAIKFFEDAQEWERAIDRIDFLRYYYQYLVFNYNSLTTILCKQAIYFRSALLASNRMYPKYFRLSFYGQFDDEAITPTSNAWVYKGKQLDNILYFTDRLKVRFPKAHMVMSSEKPNEDILKKHEQIICICVLKIPNSNKRKVVLDTYMNNNSVGSEDLKLKNYYEQWHTAVNTTRNIGPSISTAVIPSNVISKPFVDRPMNIMQFEDNTNICVFEYSRPWRRIGPNGPSTNEFSDLWLIRTYVITCESFPSNRRRLQVIGNYEEIVLPITTAIETVHSKTEELLNLIAHVAEQTKSKGSDKIDIGPLLSCLHGMLNITDNDLMQKKIEGVRKAVTKVEEQTYTEEQARIKVPHKVDVGPLSMCLNGMIDAAVNGGSSKFIEAFLTPEYVSASSVTFDDEKKDIAKTLAERRKLQAELKNALVVQIHHLSNGLDLFGKTCNDKLQGQYGHQCGMYEQMVTKINVFLEAL